MEIRYKLYPYPVLAYYSDDYKSGAFDTTIDLAKDGYNIKVDFMASLTNDGLKALILNGQAQYVYHLECAQTGYRQVVRTDKVSDSKILSDKEVCGKLQICPFIVATQDISGYTNTGFHDDYSGATFDIEAGCVLAVGKQVNATIAKEMEDLAGAATLLDTESEFWELQMAKSCIIQKYAKALEEEYLDKIAKEDGNKIKTTWTKEYDKVKEKAVLKQRFKEVNEKSNIEDKFLK